MNALSLTGRRWVLRSTEQPENVCVFLTALRGISLFDVHAFRDPSSLGDAPAAAARVHRALKENEGIGIVGDYDADGITGTVQLVRFFHRRGASPRVVIPHREQDGYGLKAYFIEQLARAGVTLLLTVDMGISHHDEIALARERGMDVIVLDHHRTGDALPHAFLVHPNLPGRAYHNPHLSGSGVVYSFLRLLENKDNWPGRGVDLALAAVGTVADVVPLVGENRTIVARGLDVLNAPDGVPALSPLLAFADSVRTGDLPLKSRDVAFHLAPRINAAGRISDPWIAFDALLTGGQALKDLEQLNQERQDATEEGMDLCEGMLDGRRAFLAAASPAFPPGIVGLLAGRLVEKYGKPAMVGSVREFRVVASLRSIEGYDVAAALERCRDHLCSCGGHAKAAGCVCDRDQWGKLKNALQEDAAERLDPATLHPRIVIDCEISPEAVREPLIVELQRLEPHGEGNPEPVFLLRNVSIADRRRVGKSQKHLKCKVRDLKAVGFGFGELMQEIPERCDVACKLQMNRWQGREEVQVVIEDIAESV
jgi:single-stranded-DNA-specific exonuclease